MDSKEKAFSEDGVRETETLETFGYTQELKRSFSLFGMVGFCFNIVASWIALSAVLVVGIGAGGPPVIIYSWIFICLFSLAVALSLAEMCSAFPVAGGQYSWVMILTPKSIARGMSWITGWFMLIGVLAMAAVVNNATANYILGMANLSFPGYVIKQWHTALVSWAVAASSAVFNIAGPSLLERISRGMMILNILSFFVIMITILACNKNKQPASFVFTQVENLTGWQPSMAVLLGILQSAFGMCCYDAPAHMTEEMHYPSTEAPKAIILSVLIGAVTGLAFLISLCFRIGDFDTVASSTTGVPVVQIFYDSTSSVAGTCVMTVLFVILSLASAWFLTAEASRELYAFARDRGLPFSSVWAKVRKGRDGTEIPVNGILLACVVQVAFNSIYFGSLTGFQTIIAIATEGFYISYAIPLLALLLHRFNHRSGRSVGNSRAWLLNGPFKLGAWGAALNAIGFLFLVFTSITFNLPSLSPVTPQNMNYTSAAVGVIMLISALTWVFDGRKSFTGPRIEGHLRDELEVVDGRLENVKSDRQ